MLTGVALAIGLGACGDDDDDSDEAAAPKTTTAETETGEPPASKGGLTPPGTKLSVGQTATVGWTPPSQSSAQGPGKAIKLQVTVAALEKGDQDDLKNISLDADQKGATPYFMKVKITNLGATAPAADEPDLTFDAIDDRRQEQGSVTFIGDFPPCENNRAPKPFSRGKSYESCLTYLVQGGSIEEIRWKDGPTEPSGVSEYFNKPVVWRP
jgi:hypothetical protein